MMGHDLDRSENIRGKKMLIPSTLSFRRHRSKQCTYVFLLKNSKLWLTYMADNYFSI